ENVFIYNSSQSVLTNAQGRADIGDFGKTDSLNFQHASYKLLKASYTDIEGLGYEVSLTEGVQDIREIVISANRWGQKKEEVPARISTISRKEVMFANPQTAADLLNATGEVYIQKSQLGGGSPMIRGFATNRVLISVDGVRMNTAIFRSGNIQNVISLDPFAIENTEVLFGPGSVMYGSDAIGGVMSFQTLAPKLSPGDHTLVTGSSVMRYSSANNERTGHFDINVGRKKWAVLTGFSQFDYNDLRMGKYGPDEYKRPFYVQRIDSLDVVVTNDDPLVQRPTGYSQTNIMQKIRFRPNDKWDFSYGFHYSTTSDYSRYDRLIRLKKGLPRSAEWYYGPQEWIMNNLNITHSAASGPYDQAFIRLAYQTFEECRIDRDMNDNERRRRVERVNASSVNLDFIKSTGKKGKLFYGLETVYDEVISTGTNKDISTNAVTEGPSRYPQSTWTSYAAYLTYQLKVSEKILMQIGARYNRFLLEAEFDTTYYPFPFTTAGLNKGALTGSAGAIYKPAESWAINVNVSTGFRSPNVDDVGKVFDSEPGSVVVPNPDLEAEYATNSEIGIAKIFGEWLKIDLTGYYTILQNALVRRDYTLDGLDSIVYDGEMSRVQAIQNAAEAYVYGMQAGICVKHSSGFGITSRINYQKGEEELDDGTTSPLRHAAPWFGSSHLTYSAHKLKLDLYAVYNGEVSYENLAEEEKGKDYMYAADKDGNPFSPASSRIPSAASRRAELSGSRWS
ncbi:MAG: TonB-dependent receptor, partial [Bacteroidetes bacterium]|nr:TonB-dependent receptor [Bacteroidota bacterium]